jgi:hypothetical protein
LIGNSLAAIRQWRYGSKTRTVSELSEFQKKTGKSRFKKAKGWSSIRTLLCGFAQRTTQRAMNTTSVPAAGPLTRVMSVLAQ